MALKEAGSPLVAEMVPLFRAGVKTVRVVVKDAKGVEHARNLSEAEIKALAKQGRVADDCAQGGKTSVYYSLDDAGNVNYVGMTDNMERRAAEQLRERGIDIRPISGLSNLTRAEARAVEQVLIELHGLSRDGGTLMNKINSIAPSNPIYAEALRRGREILKRVNYPGIE